MRYELTIDDELLSRDFGGGLLLASEYSANGRRHAHGLVDAGTEVLAPIQFGSARDGAAAGECGAYVLHEPLIYGAVGIPCEVEKRWADDRGRGIRTRRMEEYSLVEDLEL